MQIIKIRSRRAETEAQAFFREVYSFPVVTIAVGGLALGDVAIVFAVLLGGA